MIVDLNVGVSLVDDQMQILIDNSKQKQHPRLHTYIHPDITNGNQNEHEK